MKDLSISRDMTPSMFPPQIAIHHKLAISMLTIENFGQIATYRAQGAIKNAFEAFFASKAFTPGKIGS